MKIFISHASSYDYENELYEPLRKSPIFEQHEFILPMQKDTFDTSLETLQSCDLVIADVSYASTGQGIELGWAHLLNIPVICIYKSGCKYSGALPEIFNTFIEYSSHEEMIQKITSLL
jgi:nucleoside 2-deoxyribosyltransferase